MNLSSSIFSICCVLVLLAAVIITTQAQPIQAQSVSSSDTFSTLNGAVTFQWDLLTATDTNLTATITSSSASTYSAIGWSTSGMQGKGIACWFSSAVATPNCVQGNMINYNWANMGSQNSQILSSTFNTPAGGWTIKVTFPLAVLDISNTNAEARVIFASGPWSSGSPNQHNSRTSAKINLRTGSTAGQTAYWRLIVSLVCTFIWAMLLALIGNACKERHVPASPLFFVLAILTFIGSYFAVVFSFREDLIEAGKAQTLPRAFGGGILYFFMMIFLPVNKHLNIGTVAGIGFEKFINFHAIAGTQIMIFMIVHMATMIRDGGFDFAKITNEDGTYINPPLPAFIALCFVFVMWCTALLRRFFYALFRVAHILFIGVVVGVIVHYPGAGFAMIPGLLLYVADKIIQFTWMSNAAPIVAHASYDEEAKVTRLEIQLSKDKTVEVGPTQYCFFSVPGAFNIPHPFTIANYDEKNQKMTFLIREIGSATRDLGQAAKDGKVTEIGYFTAPIGGELSVPLLGEHATSETVVLCSGGIGITPSLSILNFLATKSQTQKCAIKNIKLIWSVREESLIATVKKMLETEIFPAGSNNKIFQGINVEVIIYNTFVGKDTPLAVVGGENNNNTDKNAGASTPSVSSGSNIKIISGQRPNFEEIFAQIESDQAVSSFSVYSCGPSPFMSAVSDATKNAEKSRLHEETFEM